LKYSVMADHLINYNMVLKLKYMKKNLLILYYGRDYGGGDVFLKNLVPALAEKYNVVIAAVYQAKRLREELPVKFYRIPVKKFYLLFGVFHFARLLIKEQINILFVQELALSVYARFFQIFFHKLKHLAVIHANFRYIPYKGPFRKLTIPIIYILNKISYRCVDKFVCVSNDLKKSLAKEGVPSSRIEVVYNGIMIPEKTPEIRSSEVAQIAYIGRLSYEKGIDYFLQIVQRAIERDEKMGFHVFGEGRCHEQVEEVQKRYPNKLFYHGFVADVFQKHEIDILVMPSRNEGLPFTALNALAYGVPMIASNVGGLGEIINDGVNGILCQVGDLDSYYTSILRLKNDVDLRRKMARNSRNLAQNKFNLRVMCDRYLQILNISA
jgi:glycosyltransferase involved in cell wall biosynthesis